LQVYEPAEGWTFNASITGDPVDWSQPSVLADSTTHSGDTDIDGVVTFQWTPEDDPTVIDITEVLETGYTFVEFECRDQDDLNVETNLDLNDLTAELSLANGDSYTCDFYNVLTTAVTVGYFTSTASGDGVDFLWQTATETGTAGFNIFAETGGDLVQLNDGLIPSKVVDSSAPTDYAFSAQTDATVFFLEEVEVGGGTTSYGPYALGIEYGSYIPHAIQPAIYLPLMTS
jgi:hypothetical protein